MTEITVACKSAVWSATLKTMAKQIGPAFFDAYYSEQEGSRWPRIREACTRETSHFALSGGLLQTYWLDEASVLVGRWLEARPGDRVLDLCAAPGGKSLVIAQDLFALDPPSRMDPQNLAQSELISNELSGTRRDRLWKVLREHLPPQAMERVRVFGHDATRWGQHEENAYDRILLDAPCSSERHVLQDPSYLAEWTAGRSSRLAQQSYAMVLSATQALKPGGTLVYCTCAISRAENDGVVARAMERLAKKSQDLGYQLALDLPQAGDPLLVPWMEATDLGMRILPDSAGGRGPLFLSRLKKIAV